MTLGRKQKVTTAELLGKRFGKLTIVCEASPFRRGKNTFYTVKCDCGNTKDIQKSSILSGRSKSCGKGFCNHATKHGASYTKEYSIYLGMKGRCYCKSASGYDMYGARGISVCDRWLGEDGFANFFSDMGNCPEGCSLDRIDAQGDYRPENCRWATLSLQSYNQRIKKSNTSGRTGVGFYEGSWRATIGHGGKTKSLGEYETFEEAVRAREIAELDHYGFIKEKI